MSSTCPGASTSAADDAAAGPAGPAAAQVVDKPDFTSDSPCFEHCPFGESQAAWCKAQVAAGKISLGTPAVDSDTEAAANKAAEDIRASAEAAQTKLADAAASVEAASATCPALAAAAREKEAAQSGPALAPSEYSRSTYAQLEARRDETAATSANRVNKRRRQRQYSLGEEIANSITTGLGAALSVAAIPILTVLAVQAGGGLYLASALMYTITMLLEFTMGTLYHAIAVDSAKRVFRVLDHCSAYLFAAGTCTPFCLISLRDSGGIALCVFVWVVSLVGVAFEACWSHRPRWVSAVLYAVLIVGIACFLPALVASISTPCLALLVSGGLCYLVGCIFYALKNVPYMHAVFHLFVVAGSILMFLSIALFVM